MTERPMTKEQLEEQARREQEIEALVDKLMPEVKPRTCPTLRERIQDSLNAKPQRW